MDIFDQMIESLLDQRASLEDALLGAIPDTEEYNVLFSQWQGINSELIWTQMAKEQSEHEGVERLSKEI